jgi:hypothetical protein
VFGLIVGSKSKYLSVPIQKQMWKFGKEVSCFIHFNSFKLTWIQIAGTYMLLAGLTRIRDKDDTLYVGYVLVSDDLASFTHIRTHDEEKEEGKIDDSSIRIKIEEPRTVN